METGSKLIWYDTNKGYNTTPTKNLFFAEGEASIEINSVALSTKGKKLHLNYHSRVEHEKKINHRLTHGSDGVGLEVNHTVEFNPPPPKSKDLETYLSLHGLSTESIQDLITKDHLKEDLDNLPIEYQVELLS